MPFNLSMTHLMVVAVVALMVLGPERLPGVAKTVGQFYREYKRIRGNVEGEMREAISEFKEPFREHIDTVKGAVNDFRGEVIGGAAAPSGTNGSARPSAPPLAALPLLPGATSDPSLGFTQPPELPSLGPDSGLRSAGPPPPPEWDMPDIGPPAQPGTFAPGPPTTAA